MLTKAAYIVGAVRSSNLTDEQESALKKHYGLKETSNLMLRNMGRDTVGLGSGALSGGIAGGLLTKSPVGALVGAASNGLLMSKLMTDKYSVGNAKRIMQAKTEDAQ